MVVLSKLLQELVQDKSFAADQRETRSWLTIARLDRRSLLVSSAGTDAAPSVEMLKRLLSLYCKSSI
jgi:hypothetical protein